MSTVTKLKFKDEDGGDDSEGVSNVNISVVDNGWIVKVEYEEEEVIYVATTREQLMKIIKDSI